MLRDLGAGSIPLLNALNKVDRMGPAVDEVEVEHMAEELDLRPEYVAISARHNWGLEPLRQRIEHILDRQSIRLEVTIPYDRPDLVTLFHERGHIEEQEYRGEGVYVRGLLPQRYLYAFEKLERQSLDSLP